jgi:hypothetical protein
MLKRYFMGAGLAITGLAVAGLAASVAAYSVKLTAPKSRAAARRIRVEEGLPMMKFLERVFWFVDV